MHPELSIPPRLVPFDATTCRVNAARTLRGMRSWVQTVVGLIHGTSIIISHINPSSRRIVANSVWHHAINSPVQSSLYFQLFPLGFTTICIKYDTTFKTWRHHFLRYSHGLFFSGWRKHFSQAGMISRKTVTLALTLTHLQCVSFPHWCPVSSHVQ